ncbi:hypothetical protein RAM80_28335 [Pseudomonas sp. App30]|uniref:hypothetical protein n=1 Tax=Pseudomonas sp. App30 TaxID=3068990 RepID=UPI003A800225
MVKIKAHLSIQADKRGSPDDGSFKLPQQAGGVKVEYQALFAWPNQRHEQPLNAAIGIGTTYIFTQMR